MNDRPDKQKVNYRTHFGACQSLLRCPIQSHGRLLIVYLRCHQSVENRFKVLASDLQAEAKLITDSAVFALVFGSNQPDLRELQ